MGEEQFSGRENLGDAEHEGAMRRCSLSLTLALPPSLCPPFIPPPALGGGKKHMDLLPVSRRLCSQIRFLFVEFWSLVLSSIVSGQSGEEAVYG